MARTPFFKVWREPPDGMAADPSFGYEGLENDPMPPRMFLDIGIDEILKSIKISTFAEYNQVVFAVDRFCAEQMNFDQRWVLSCGMLHIMSIFIGNKMDDRLEHNIKQQVGQFISYLAQSEIRPGEWEDENHQF
jgi:hypothetical protein